MYHVSSQSSTSTLTAYLGPLLRPMSAVCISSSRSRRLSPLLSIQGRKKSGGWRGGTPCHQHRTGGWCARSGWQCVGVDVVGGLELRTPSSRSVDAMFQVFSRNESTRRDTTQIHNMTADKEEAFLPLPPGVQTASTSIE